MLFARKIRENGMGAGRDKDGFGGDCSVALAAMFTVAAPVRMDDVPLAVKKDEWLVVTSAGWLRRVAYCRAIAIRTASSGETR